MIDLTTLLARSSNVGATKVAMSLPSEQLWSVLSRFGLGKLDLERLSGRVGRAC